MVWTVLISPLVSNPANLFPSLWEKFQTHQLQIVSLTPSWSIDFSSLKQDPGIYLFAFLWSVGTVKSTRWQVLFVLFLVCSSGFQNPREFYAFHSPGKILVCAYTIWHYSQILIYCTIPNRSSFTVMPNNYDYWSVYFLNSILSSTSVIFSLHKTSLSWKTHVVLSRHGRIMLRQIITCLRWVILKIFLESPLKCITRKIKKNYFRKW